MLLGESKAARNAIHRPYFISQLRVMCLSIWHISIHEHASLRYSMGTASVCQRLEVLKDVLDIVSCFAGCLV